MGECVPQGTSARDGGVSDASVGDASARVDSAVRTDGATDTGDSPVALAPVRRGCQCAAPGAAVAPKGALLTVALAFLALRRRRRAVG